MAAYVIAKVRVTVPSGYEEYRRMVGPTIAKYGGRFLARGGRAESLEGEATVERVIVLEFPSYEQAVSWYESDDYAPAKRQRRACSEAELMVVEGV